MWEQRRRHRQRDRGPRRGVGDPGEGDPGDRRGPQGTEPGHADLSRGRQGQGRRPGRRHLPPALRARRGPAREGRRRPEGEPRGRHPRGAARQDQGGRLPGGGGQALRGDRRRARPGGGGAAMPTRRLFALMVSLAALAALAWAAAPASAKENDLQRGRSENAAARSFVDRSLAAAKGGDYARAYALAKTGYLDHYEYVEIPLRLRDPNLVLDTEFQFAQLRTDLQKHKPLGVIRADVRDVRQGILDTDRKLAAKGVAAPSIAFAFSFTILFREGVEAVLVIAILLGSPAARQAPGPRRPL